MIDQVSYQSAIHDVAKAVEQSNWTKRHPLAAIELTDIIRNLTHLNANRENPDVTPLPLQMNELDPTDNE